LAEGPLWETILYHYTPAGRAGPIGHLDDRIEVLILRRRSPAAPHAAAEVPAVTARIGEEIAVPEHAWALSAVLDLRLTPAGRILSLLHQTPWISLTVRRADGTVREHRLIADIARAGFLVSPYLATAQDLESLYRGPSPPASRVTALRVEVPAAVAWAFEQEIAARFRALARPDPPR
jgi:hypothetical protein